MAPVRWIGRLGAWAKSCESNMSKWWLTMVNMVVYGCLWLFMVVCGCLWLFMVVYGCLWLFMVVSKVFSGVRLALEA